jgi:hypothetical protein
MDNSGKITAENVIASRRWFPVIDPIKVDYADVVKSNCFDFSFDSLGTWCEPWWDLTW